MEATTVIDGSKAEPERENGVVKMDPFAYCEKLFI
jgi:hypothetical protein